MSSVRTRYGELATLSNDRPISQALEIYGEWAQLEIDFLNQFLLSSRVIMDVGGHIGVHACAFASISNDVEVHTFEPQPRLLDLLSKNTARFGGRVHVHSVAVGSEVGAGFVRELPTNVPINAGAVAISSTDFANSIEVRLVSIDSMNLQPDFIKLDVEGYEAAALAGAAATIRRCKPTIFCEVNNIENGAAVVGAMRAYGYDAYLVATPAFNPNNFAKCDQNIFGVATETALLFVPTGRPTPKQTLSTTLSAVRSVDDLALAFLKAPRFGDESDSDRDPARLRAELVALRATLESEQNQAVQLNSNLRKLEDRLSDYHSLGQALLVERQKSEELEVAVEQQRSLHEAAQTKLSATVGEASALRESLASTEGQLSKTRAQLADALRQIESVTAQLEAANAERQRQLTTIEQYVFEQAAMSEAVAALQASATELRAAVNAAENKAEATDRRFEGLRGTLQKERDATSQVRERLADEEGAHRQTSANVELERARRFALLQFTSPADVPVASKGSLGALARRYTRGPLADAVREIEDSDLFEESWYVQNYGERIGQFHPAAHYLLRGGYEGLDPGPKFSSSGYLEVNSDVRASGMNPLLHYLRWGARELRRWTAVPVEARPTVPQRQQTDLWSRPAAPPLALFRRLAEQLRSKSKTAPIVDVIVPVYRSYDDTLACIASILESENNTAFELVVIDDCSPEPEVSAALDELADMGLLTLLRNEKNLGFVGTVNRGMAINGDRDVLLLNSDTLVFNNWLDRIRDHATKHDRIATVTPFTTNGTICSYPKFCRDNKEAFGRPFDEVDRIFAAVNSGQSIEIPTGVGFCMYISRACLNEVGLFDEETFGKGYGEENDFCMRASKFGWKNLHALDTFVFHSGETSFAETAQESKRRGLALLHQKHPEYDELVQAYISRDPSRASRIAADVAQLFGYAPAKATLCITHTSGGGIDRYLQDYARAQSQTGRDILLLLPAAPGTTSGRLAVPGAPASLPNLDGVDISQDIDVLRDALRLLHVDQIEIHSTVGWSYKLPAMIERLADACSLRYSAMLHDYVALCPQINFINETGVYCGEEGNSQCHRCLSLMKDQPRAIHPDIDDPARLNIVAWRKMYGRLLDHAHRVLAPSSDTRDRVRRYFVDLDIEVVPHAEDLSRIPKLAKQPVAGRALRVGIIGAIGPHKGSRVLLGCARDALKRTLPLQFVVIGYSDIDRELEQSHVLTTGRYKEEDIAEVLAAQRIDIAFLPSVWPETFCYTLSIAMAAGYPICVFDLGAQAERLQSYSPTLILPSRLMVEPSHINDRLMKFGERLRAGDDRLGATEHSAPVV